MKLIGKRYFLWAVMFFATVFLSSVALAQQTAEKGFEKTLSSINEPALNQDLKEETRHQADQDDLERIRIGKREYQKGLEACNRKYTSRALKLLTKATQYGHTGAMLKLGQMYFDGELVVQDQEKAFYWYLKAAKAKNPIGEYKVGMMYLRGQGIKRDRNEAAVWLKKSAEQGYSRAQTNYGSLHLVGYGVKQDFIEAVKWFRKAADQNYGDAQYLMGVAYEYGEGVAQDIEIAKSWYRKAVSNGSGNATGPLYRLEGYQR